MDTSASLSRENEIAKDKEATFLALKEVLSRNGSSQASAHYSRGKQHLENIFKRKIICKFYDSHEDDFFCFEGVVHSKNENRLSFFTEWQIEPEMPLFIRYKTPLNNGNKDSLDDGEHAEVISCRKSGIQNDENRYLIDVEYF